MQLHWEDNFQIQVEIEGDTAVISANRAGLLSLAGHLTVLAGEVPGSHLHLDEYNGLEDHSAELILVKTADDPAPETAERT